MKQKPTLAQARKLEALIAQVRELGINFDLIAPSYEGHLLTMENNVSKYYRKTQEKK